MEFLVYFLILVAALLGTPIFVIMSLFGLYSFYLVDTQGSALIIEMYRIASAPTLLTIPLFTFAGYMMAESKSPKRLLDFAHATLGWLPGGVAIVSLVICAFFTAFTGASGVTIIALGGLLFPILQKQNFSEEFTLGLITTSGSLGLLFPPSLPIILYGLVAKTDIDKLFLAGVVPGFLLIVILSIYSIRNGQLSERTAFSFKEVVRTFKASFWEILLPIGVLYGIYGGVTTPSEASAFTAFYVLVMECFIYKDLSFRRDIPSIIKESMTLVGAILLILCCALGMTSYLVDEEIPMQILEVMREYISNKYVFLAFLNVFLLIVGSLMDIFSAIIVVVPLIIPIAAEFQIDPIHLAIIFLTNLEIGYITPPVGINLFISSFRFNKPVTTLYKASLPFLGLLLIALLLITYIPSLSLFWFN